MRKITTYKQAINLQKAGLHEHTADLWRKDNGIVSKSDRFRSYDDSTTDAPAWTLTALLEVMPSEVWLNGEGYGLQLHKFFDPELEMDSFEIGYFDLDMCSPRGGWSDNVEPLDAAVELCLWLLEKELIDKKYCHEQEEKKAEA